MQNVNGTAVAEQTLFRKFFKVALAAMVAMVCACAFTLVSTDQAEAATALGAKKVSTSGKWTVSNSKVYYKVDGKKVTGLVNIGAKAYYFDSDGVQRDGWRKIGPCYYFFKHATKADGYMRADTIINGIELNKHGEAQLVNKTQVAEIAIYVKAQKELDKVTKPTWSKSKKLEAAFDYVNGARANERVVHGWTSKTGWHRMFAKDVIYNYTGDCNSMGCAMAYMGNAVGCSKCECVASGGHGWARIDGKIYDPEWSPLGSRLCFALEPGNHPNVKVDYEHNDNYVVNLNRTKLWTGTKLATSSSLKNGIVKSGGDYYYFKNGSRVCSKWVTYKGYKYYLKSSGIAATKSCKIGGTYYVFSTTGKLKTGTKTRNVKVDGKVYRVNKYGKAVKGWTHSTETGNLYRYYKASGLRSTGISCISDQLHYLGSTGIRSASKTQALQDATAMLDDAQPLLDLMNTYEGEPTDVYAGESCPNATIEAITGDSEVLGIDRIYTYDHVKINTWSQDYEGATEYLVYVSAA